jgi:methyltransferase (TIGR00027 family)
MSEEAIQANLLGATARWTAGVRALESLREDHLFTDPWAAALAGEMGQQWASNLGPTGLTMVIRTRFFDDFLQGLSHQEASQQVVFLAPGLDTRAFRLDWSAQTNLYELDQPEVFAYKEPILNAAGAQAICERHIIQADLTVPWKDKLLQTGFDPQKPAVWLLEGFLFYLPNAAIACILDDVTSLASAGSWVGFDIINSAVLTSELLRPWIEKMAKSGVPWQGSIDDPVEFLAQRGWKASLVAIGEKEANYGRWPFPVVPGTSPDVPHNWFVTACKE